MCTTLFTPKRKGNKTCSTPCARRLGAKNSLVSTSCSICLTAIMFPKSGMKQGLPRYCGACGKQRYRNKCKECSLTFQAKRREVQYCSNECLKIGNSKKVRSTLCAGCGITFERTSSSIPSNKRHFCSKRCNQRRFAFENGNRYGSDWTTWRKRCIERDLHTCQKCGKKEFEKYELNVHHIIPIEEFNSPKEANYIENLLVLCFGCHMSVHRPENQPNKFTKHK